jgi:hypothetical protein
MCHLKLTFTLSFVLSPLLVAQQANGSAKTQAPANPAASSQSASKAVILPKHTYIQLVFLEEVSPATAVKGQKVRMVVDEDVEVKGVVVIPRGTPATGVVTRVRKAIPGKRDGFVWVEPFNLNLLGSPPVALRDWDDPSGDGMCTGFFCDLALSVAYGAWWAGDHITKPSRKNHETGEEHTVDVCSADFAEPSGRAALYPIAAGALRAPPGSAELNAACPNRKLGSSR